MADLHHTRDLARLEAPDDPVGLMSQEHMAPDRDEDCVRI